jgi:hypothetical protein
MHRNPISLFTVELDITFESTSISMDSLSDSTSNNKVVLNKTFIPIGYRIKENNATKKSQTGEERAVEEIGYALVTASTEWIQLINVRNKNSILTHLIVVGATVYL